MKLLCLCYKYDLPCYALFSTKLRFRNLKPKFYFISVMSSALSLGYEKEGQTWENRYSEADLPDNWTDRYETFDTMGLPEDLLKGIYSYGFTSASNVQQKALVPFARGRDLILRGMGGTGKTATYAIGLLAQLDCTQHEIQALVLTPTRELAMGTERVISNLGQYLDAIGHVCVGGTRVKNDIESIKRGPHFVVGTPGRILDMIKRRVLKTDVIRTLVLDEADELISRGFIDQLHDIFISLPHSTQIGIVSATLPPEVLDIAKWMKDPVRVIKFENKPKTDF